MDQRFIVVRTPRSPRGSAQQQGDNAGRGVRGACGDGGGDTDELEEQGGRVGGGHEGQRQRGAGWGHLQKGGSEGGVCVYAWGGACVYVCVWGGGAFVKVTGDGLLA